MSEQSEKNIRQALYVAVANKLQGDLSELEAKEILLTSNPAYITSKEHDHAEHIEELYNIIVKKTEIKGSLKSQKIIVEGLGKVGYYAAAALREHGCRIIGVIEHHHSFFNEKGLDIDLIKKWLS